MTEVKARVKKWGSSLGIVIPAPVVRREGLKPGDEVRVQVERPRLTMEELRAAVRPHLKNFDLKKALKDLEDDDGWHD